MESGQDLSRKTINRRAGPGLWGWKHNTPQYLALNINPHCHLVANAAQKEGKEGGKPLKKLRSKCWEQVGEPMASLGEAAAEPAPCHTHAGGGEQRDEMRCSTRSWRGSSHTLRVSPPLQSWLCMPRGTAFHSWLWHIDTGNDLASG